ncbi:SUMO-conjugating enzyme UBC9, partial [Trichinella pseudospiralis]
LMVIIVFIGTVDLQEVLIVRMFQVDQKKSLPDEVGRQVCEQFVAYKKKDGFNFIANPVTKNGQEDFSEWVCGFPGRKGTLWEGALLKLKVTFPSNYPVEPPAFIFDPPIPHPNVYPNGYVCLSMLDQTNWKQGTTVSQLFKALDKIMAHPDRENPANAVAFFEFCERPEKYNERMRKAAKKFNFVQFAKTYNTG